MGVQKNPRCITDEQAVEPAQQHTMLKHVSWVRGMETVVVVDGSGIAAWTMGHGVVRFGERETVSMVCTVLKAKAIGESFLGQKKKR